MKYTKLLKNTLLAALIINSGLATADEFMGKCLLEVNKTKYIDGTCAVSMDKDGSFRVGVSDKNPSPYFAYISVIGKNSAEGSWNAEKTSTHAQAPLGELTRKGACWQNAKAKVCAWK